MLTGRFLMVLRLMDLLRSVTQTISSASSRIAIGTLPIQACASTNLRLRKIHVLDKLTVSFVYMY